MRRNVDIVKRAFKFVSCILLSYDSAGLFPHVCVFLGWVVLPLPAAVAAPLQPVGLPGLGSLLLQDLSVIQNLKAWDLTDNVLPEKVKGCGQTWALAIYQQMCHPYVSSRKMSPVDTASAESWVLTNTPTRWDAVSKCSDPGRSFTNRNNPHGPNCFPRCKFVAFLFDQAYHDDYAVMGLDHRGNSHDAPNASSSPSVHIHVTRHFLASLHFLVSQRPSDSGWICCCGPTDSQCVLFLLLLLCHNIWY